MEVATERVCQSLSVACCAAAGWKDAVKHCVGTVMPSGVLTSHLYAELLPPWTAAVQAAPAESPELPHLWASAQALTAGMVLSSSPALGQLLRAQCELESL